MPKLYVIGDSTVAEFNDVNYYYPRYGYGAVLNQYFDLEIINLALSGRSSRSYTFENEYKNLFEQLNKGDYVLIGFGHNDEKDDDIFRFSSANLPIDNPKSIKYVLYYNYIEKILKLGATPILTTPVVRLSKNDIYENEAIHITKNGDYRKAIIELADSFNLLSIDITTESLNLVKSLGYNNSLILHSMTKGKMVNGILSYDEKSVDKTHLSYYGALYSAFFIAKGVYNSNLELKKYIKNINEPNKNSLLPNPLYKYKEYKTPNLDNYYPDSNFSNSNYYGTAFGNIDSNNPTKDGFIAKIENDKYIVGQSGNKLHGKINASQEGFAFLFKRINRSDNFKISANAKIIKCANIRQSCFGLMLRGDSYLNQESPNETIVTNFIASGLVTTDKVTYAIFDRPSTTDLGRRCSIGEYFYKENDTAYLEINRLGQVVDVLVKYEGKTYTKQYIDFDYYNDQNYLFVGMIGTNGTVVEYTDVNFKITGKAKEA